MIPMLMCQKISHVKNSLSSALLAVLGSASLLSGLFLTSSVALAQQSQLTPAQAERQFHRALLAAQRDRPDVAHKILEQIRKRSTARGTHLIDPHLLNITEARVLFQMNRLNEVPGLYRSVPQSSPLWLEAREELAWTYLRQEMPEKALAELKSLMTPFFRDTLGSEPFVAAGLAHLSTCDYVSIFKLSKEFKERFLPKVEALAELVSGSNDSKISLDQALTALKENSQIQLSGLLPRLPRKLIQDPEILQALIRYPAQASKRAALRRSQQLAKAELEEIKQMVQKVHLIEAEAIQRMEIENRMARRDSLRSSGHPHQGEVLFFPATREVWRDEIGNFSVDVKECPPLKLAGK